MGHPCRNRFTKKDPMSIFDKVSNKKPVRYTGDAKKDIELPEKHDDPREGKTIYKTKDTKNDFFGGGRNTKSFEPSSCFVRPQMRIIVGPIQKYYP